MSEVVLNEEFDSATGEWINYDAYDPNLRVILRDQQHVDIRTGQTSDVTVPLNVLELSKRNVGSMAGAPVSSFGAPTKVLKRGEHWSMGRTESMVAYDYRPALIAPIWGGGTTTVESVIATPGQPVGTQKRNYVINPSFEGTTDGWETVTNGPPVTFFTQDQVWSQFGGYCGRVQTTHAAGANESGARINYDIAVKPNQTYSAGAWLRIWALAAGGSAYIGVDWYTSAHAFISRSNSGVFGTVGGFTHLTWNDSAPANAAYARIGLYSTGYTGGSTLYYDGIHFTDGIVTDYFDGYTTGYYWTGTPHNSPTEGPVEFTLETIDLLTGFENDDLISVTLPGYPLADINRPSSFMDFTSNPQGNFSAGPTASVALSANTIAWPGGSFADSEFRILRSTMQQNSINLGAITGVRFRLAGTNMGAVVNFQLGALRLLSKKWKYGPVDTNTRYGELRKPWPKNAAPATAAEYSQPILWKAADVSGEEDPKPIDFNIAVGFNTGSRIGSNQISIYGRELTEDFMQQLDLNGLSMAQMTGRDQPDLGEAMFNPRHQTDLEPFKQDQLGGLSQFDLERTPDFLSASWIEFVLAWNPTNTQLSVVNTEGDGYNFTLASALAANTNYALVFSLADTSARAAIYPLGDRGQIIFNAPVFDSTQIDDDFSYKRRKGRFGWYASLADGDAYITSVRFRSASYAEYRSLPYESLTPVDGAELSAEFSPVIDLFQDFGPTDPDSIVVERDGEVSTTGSSWRVTDYGPWIYQGVQSNLFAITDFDQTEVLLDVYYPSSTELAASVEFYLKSDADYLIPLPKPRIYPDQWQTVRLRTPSSHLAQTGNYRLVVVQNRPANLNWWIDNVRIFERTVSWHGRSFVEDPWAATEDDWTPFQNSLNRDFGGILFQGRERKLQVKGVGHKQSAGISKVQFKPKYAELGRFAWPEQRLVGKIAPVASYSTSNNGRTYTFNGFGSSDVDGMVVNWYWTVSDGSVYVGPIIQHKFGAAGTYTVTLMVTDHNGLVNTTSAIHSVA